MKDFDALHRLERMIVGLEKERKKKMLKGVKYIDYNANYAYAPPEADAVINTDEIVTVIALSRENTRRPFDDLVHIVFRNRTELTVLGKPQDFVEIKSAE